jgi:hypothetical protein
MMMNGMERSEWVIDRGQSFQANSERRRPGGSVRAAAVTFYLLSTFLTSPCFTLLPKYFSQHQLIMGYTLAIIGTSPSSLYHHH